MTVFEPDPGLLDFGESKTELDMALLVSGFLCLALTNLCFAAGFGE